jgi:hypothetical protein
MRTRTTPGAPDGAHEKRSRTDCWSGEGDGGLGGSAGHTRPSDATSKRGVRRAARAVAPLGEDRGIQQVLRIVDLEVVREVEDVSHDGDVQGPLAQRTST